MTKSLLMGITACVALALVGPTFAFAKHPTPKHPIRRVEYGRHDPNNWTRPYPTQLHAPKPVHDPLYESCESPWKHPDVSCPWGNDAGG